MDWTRISNTVERLLSAQQGLCVSFSWKEKSFSGCRTNLKAENVNTNEGLLMGNYKFSLLCPSAQFNGRFPEPRTDTVIVEGKQMRVLAWEQDAVHACVRIDLGGILA